MNNLKFSELEPVRLIGWLTTAIVVAASIAKQWTDNYDEGTGWMGAVLGLVMAIATEMQRNRVIPVAKIENNIAGTRYTNTEG